jgi:fluoride ion exporter CrcB/FEX
MKMADEQAGNAQPAVSDPDGAHVGSGGLPKSPGWYPDRASPNDQSYWDGQNWTARRRWTSGKGWLVAGDAPEEAMSDSAPPSSAPRLSANPYLALAPTRSKATGFTFNLGVLILLVCGIALMYGSVGAWVHLSGSIGVADLRVSLNGIDPGISTLISVNGWVTFIGGTLIVIFACFEMTSEEIQLAILTTLITAVTTVFAIYDMFRIVQKISQVPSTANANASVGWGLICVLSAAVLATLIALVRLLQH